MVEKTDDVETWSKSFLNLSSSLFWQHGQRHRLVQSHFRRMNALDKRRIDLWTCLGLDLIVNRNLLGLMVSAGAVFSTHCAKLWITCARGDLIDGLCVDLSGYMCLCD